MKAFIQSEAGGQNFQGVLRAPAPSYFRVQRKTLMNPFSIRNRSLWCWYWITRVHILQHTHTPKVESQHRTGALNNALCCQRLYVLSLNWEIGGPIVGFPSASLFFHRFLGMDGRWRQDCQVNKVQFRDWLEVIDFHLCRSLGQNYVQQCESGTGKSVCHLQSFANTGCMQVATRKKSSAVTGVQNNSVACHVRYTCENWRPLRDLRTPACNLRITWDTLARHTVHIKQKFASHLRSTCGHALWFWNTVKNLPSWCMWPLVWCGSP